MRGFLKIAFVLLVSAVLAIAQSNYSHSYGTTTYGDVRIETLNNGTIKCDKMICPPQASNCRVTKRNDPNNFKVIVRQRLCLDVKGAVIQEEKVNEPNPENKKVNLTINSGSAGNSVNNNGGTSRQMTPEEQRELQERLRRNREEMQERMRRNQQELQERLRRNREEMQAQISRDKANQWRYNQGPRDDYDY